MPKLEWSDELSVGVVMIDSQHQELIRIANLIIDTVKRNEDKDNVDMVVGKLREYMVFHCRCEEGLMDRIHYAGRDAQVREHVRLKKEIEQFQRKLYLEEEVTSETILEFITNWIIKHILTYDRDLAKFIHTEAEKDSTKTDESQAARHVDPQSA